MQRFPESWGGASDPALRTPRERIRLYHSTMKAFVCIDDIYLHSLQQQLQIWINENKMTIRFERCIELNLAPFRLFLCVRVHANDAQTRPPFSLVLTVHSPLFWRELATLDIAPCTDFVYRPRCRISMLIIFSKWSLQHGHD